MAYAIVRTVRPNARATRETDREVVEVAVRRLGDELARQHRAAATPKTSQKVQRTPLPLVWPCSCKPPLGIGAHAPPAARIIPDVPRGGCCDNRPSIPEGVPWTSSLRRGNPKGPDPQRLGSPRVVVAPARRAVETAPLLLQQHPGRGGEPRFRRPPEEEETRGSRPGSRNPVRVQPPLRPRRAREAVLRRQGQRDPVDLKGRSKPFKDSRESVFDVDFDDLDLAQYSSTSPSRSRRGSSPAALGEGVDLVRPAQRLGVGTRRSGGEGGEPHHRGRGLRSARRAPAAEVVLASLDVFGGKARIESARFDAPEIHVRLARTRA